MSEQSAEVQPPEVCCTHCGYCGPGKHALTIYLTWHSHFCPRCGYMAHPASLAGGRSS